MDVVDAVGWLGSAVLVISLLQTRVMRFRVLNTISCAVLIGYNAVVGVWPMVAMNVVLVGINLWVMARLLRERHDARAYEAVVMGVAEPFLRRLLDRHRRDIATFNPELPADDPVRDAEHAFVVTTGDQVVGVVLTRTGDRPDEQQVVLDYVLPPYRDFTPGEFVFRPDGPFADLGTRTVVASPGMTSSERYLETVGFVREDGRRVLHLAA
ncbi:YgjV family protein [Cellulomonas carbonis]|uniref:YgjV family protein n=1 Tax=Cellulomonas carbonis T26 TaxID=947969 RepID=A0A0A0BPB0_9CELL|nr:YgjV family protein [Cellulomonas carbonis]KGM08944.1 hypothetical protein N868_05200 [Cellulomonas carbonis T26]GGB96901.1 hypothetical protein GCM10010972_07070 [Cellulomonas carbonis]